MQSTNTLPEGVINGKISQSGRSSSVERSVRDRKAVGSIPAVPTFESVFDSGSIISKTITLRL